MKNEKELPDDIKNLFDQPPEPRNLSGEWFDKIEAMDTKTDDQIDAWIAQIEAKITEGKPWR